MTVDKTELQDALKALLEKIAILDEAKRNEAGIPEILTNIVSVRSFADVGLLTNNAGLVIKTADRGEFHLTIVRSH
jgi:predicted fused transcriptional regulator/phosphomethylpyrimidine kinase